MKRPILIGFLCVIGIAGLVIVMKPPTPKAARGKGPRIEDAKPLDSLVLLLRSPRKIDRASLAAMAEEAWGITLASGDANAEEFILGDGPSFTLQAGGHQFQIHNYDRPYTEDVAKIAAKFTDPKKRQAMLEHRAWVAVDVVEGQFRLDPKVAYQLLGKLLAQFAGDDCLAVFSPREERMHIYEAATPARLRSDDPRLIFVQPTTVQVAEIDNDDPRLKAQVAEARRRWPEFLAAFAQRDKDQSFCVKAPFGDAETTEAMWVAVEAIEDGTLYGTLADAPVLLRSPREGEKVHVKAQDIYDWEYTQGNVTAGGFTKN